MIKRMVLMLAAVGLLFGAILGYEFYKAHMVEKGMASRQPPPVTVSATRAGFQTWQPELNAVGTLRAVRGVDITSEIFGLVRSVHFESGNEVRAGQVLVQLNADSDVAQLHSLEAAAELARTVIDRDTKQLAVQAVSQATVDADAADLKSKRALVAQQAAVIDKKTIRAPFTGKLGISTVDLGQYINPGDKIVTLQALDSVYTDFYLPQQDLSLISTGQKVVVSSDTYPGRAFDGKITAINPQVDSATHNIQVEATMDNPRHELLPGMYVTIDVRAGEAQRYLTLPRTAVAFNPYGETVYLVEEGRNGPDGQPILTVKETLVTVGPSRGDQIAILKGVKEGDTVVTSGQLKLKNRSSVVINNRVQPTSEAAPKLVDE